MKRLYLSIPDGLRWRFGDIREGVIRCVRDHEDWYIDQRTSYSHWENSDQQLEKRGEQFADEAYDAVVAYAHYPHDYNLLKAVKKPVVMVSPDLYSEEMFTIHTDTAYGVELVVQHVLRCGYEEVALIDQAHTKSELRIDTHDLIKAHCEAVGIRVTALRLKYVEQDLKSWLTTQKRNLYVMMFTANDAEYAMDCASNLGIQVPQELGIMLLDRYESMRDLYPEFTSLANDNLHMGYLAAEAAIRWAETGEAPASVAALRNQYVIPGQTSRGASFRHPEVVQAIRLMKQQYSTGQNVQGVIQQLCLTRRTLERKFQEDLNQSPSEYLLELKLNRVKALLSESVLPITKICERSGFKDASHLSRLFKKRLGMSPRVYRQMHRG